MNGAKDGFPWVVAYAMFASKNTKPAARPATAPRVKRSPRCQASVRR
jgi:hypothetical protein